ncbi:hypothetical protein J6590_108201 [Homalodisca vitripennis]|nr:hypothetical protein J6590_108201 [Homalodisca vitripennis]
MENFTMVFIIIICSIMVILSATYALFLHVVCVVYSQHNFTSQHWINGSTHIAHAIPNKTKINLYYSPQSSDQPLLSLNYLNITHEKSGEFHKDEPTGATLSFEDDSEYDLNDLYGGEGMNSSEEILTSEDNYTYYNSNSENSCCQQFDECLEINESFKKDIEDYITRIQQLNGVIIRLNATIHVLEHDAEVRNRDLYELKSGRSRCKYYRKRNMNRYHRNG